MRMRGGVGLCRVSACQGVRVYFCVAAMQVHSVEGGDHGLVLPRGTEQRKGARQAGSSSGSSAEHCEETEQEAALRQVVSAVAEFVKVRL